MSPQDTGKGPRNEIPWTTLRLEAGVPSAVFTGASVGCTHGRRTGGRNRPRGAQRLRCVPPPPPPVANCGVPPPQANVGSPVAYEHMLNAVCSWRDGAEYVRAWLHDNDAGKTGTPQTSVRLSLTVRRRQCPRSRPSATGDPRSQTSTGWWARTQARERKSQGVCSSTSATRRCS